MSVMRVVIVRGLSHPPAEPGLKAAPTPPLRSASIRIRSSTLLRIKRRSTRSGVFGLPRLPRVWARPRACTSARGSQSESRTMTDMMLGRSMPKLQARAESRKRKASLQRQLIPLSLLQLSPLCTSALRRATSHRQCSDQMRLFRSATSNAQAACMTVKLSPSILIEALNGPKALGSWHTIVNPLQAALAPLGRGPLLQKAVHALMHNLTSQLTFPHQNSP